MTIPIYSAIAIFPQLVIINLRSYILISGPFIQMLKDNSSWLFLMTTHILLFL